MGYRIHIDQLHNEVSIPARPRRIISVVPSQTELLYHLGLEEEVVGITKFCVHPEEWFRNKTRIGGTKTLDLDKIRALQPDLIIANKEENQQEQITALQMEFPVWVSDIHTLDEALQMIRRVGEITGYAKQGLALSMQIQEQFKGLHEALPVTELHAAYFIWRNPWMVAGGDTFIHHMLAACGLTNVLADMPRYPAVTLEELTTLFKDVPPAQQLILLSSEPYPFKEQHIAEIQAVLPGAQIRLVDGEMFSWYGSRLLEAPEYLRELLHSSSYPGSTGNLL
ncbi:ABC-type Fe3+-hydroxamate transport system, substrate-binding protein [Chitinophaga rupis]|uniref:ABC-type Fe3+-hydroxamate transport system, substrate-binding protein n=1 Tax=Chitinophaga rupis TaxID=573321 RepID=A0A1H8A7E4_9BACT|nr:helical backbone metal receptor [Chitinophaga rupis]SEM66531.1 ABC-type Fe3+-hydroxamate transport system, substrate-binding protein [Chitinophaga rupis]